MKPVDYEVSLDDVAIAWKAIEEAIVHHLDTHKELPSLLYVGMAGVAAIQWGALGDAVEEIRVIAVAHWEPTTTMTVA
jgi:hypothetical protein